MAVTGHAAAQRVSEVVGTVTLHLHADGLAEGDTEGLGTLLKHTHQFLGILEVVVHKHPVVEAGRILNFFLDISQIITILHGDQFAVHFHIQIADGVTVHVHGLLEGDVVLVLAEHTLDLLGVVVDALEAVGGV